MPEARRVFEISPKTPHDQISWPTGRSRSFHKMAITSDMVANARELAPELPWPFILSNVRCQSHGKDLTGEVAIYHSLSQTVGAVAHRMSWDMHAPELVYASGFHVAWSLGKEQRKLNDLASAAKERRRQFADPVAEAETLARETFKAARVTLLEREMKSAVQDYAEQFVPNADYQQIVVALLYSGHNNMPRALRAEICEKLTEGDLAGAYQRSLDFIFKVREHLPPELAKVMASADEAYWISS